MSLFAAPFHPFREQIKAKVIAAPDVKVRFSVDWPHYFRIESIVVHDSQVFYSSTLPIIGVLHAM